MTGRARAMKSLVSHDAVFCSDGAAAIPKVAAQRGFELLSWAASQAGPERSGALVAATPISQGMFTKLYF
jgi:hypothetical protein